MVGGRWLAAVWLLYVQVGILCVHPFSQSPDVLNSGKL